MRVTLILPDGGELLAAGNPAWVYELASRFGAKVQMGWSL